MPIGLPNDGLGSKIFKRLMGTTCKINWRHDDREPRQILANAVEWAYQQEIPPTPRSGHAEAGWYEA